LDEYSHRFRYFGVIDSDDIRDLAALEETGRQLVLGETAPQRFDFDGRCIHATKDYSYLKCSQ
jgi:hypothetical protein